MQVTRNASCINKNLDSLGNFRSTSDIYEDMDEIAVKWMVAPYPPWNTKINLPAWTPENRGY